MARLMLDAQVASPQALLEFTQDFGAYVTGYTVARDLVDLCIGAPKGKGWQALHEIVTGPQIDVLDGAGHSCARHAEH